MINLVFPENGFLFDTHTDLQNEFIKRIHTDGIDSATEWLRPVKDGKEVSYPREITFSWEGDTAPFTLELSTDKDFSSPERYVTDLCSVSVGNLLIGTTYYWRVNDSEIRSFSTASNVPRFIKIDGVPNVRDIGGGKIRQGILFRGGELERCYTITEEGINTFANVLKIKTEMDLRADRVGKITASPAGETVNLVQLPYRPYDEVFEDEHKKGIVKIMDFLSGEENYPVFFHCLGGADRTGMISIYLKAIAGESDDEIHTDYELTSLSAYAMGIAEGARADGFRKRTSEYYNNFIEKIREYAPGTTLSNQIVCFLEDCGVKTETIEKIRSIIRS